MAKTLSELLTRYNPNGRIRDIMQSGISNGMRADRENKILEIKASFPFTVTKDLLYKIEEDIKAEYELSQVRIFPAYPSSLFSYEYVSEIICETVRSGIISKGFFSKYTYELTDGKLCINIYFNDSGVELLREAELPKYIEKIIYDEFGINIKVSIQRHEEYLFDPDEYDKEQKKRMSELYFEMTGGKKPVQNAGGAVITGAQVNSVVSGEENTGAVVVCEKIIKSGYLNFDINKAELKYGDLFDIDNTVSVTEITAEGKTIITLGEIIECEMKEIRSKDGRGRTDRRSNYFYAVNFIITDKRGSVYCKASADKEEAQQLYSSVSEGDAVAVRGIVRRDSFDGELYIDPMAIQKISLLERTDTAEEKRVELHLHTQLSAMDAVIPPADVVKTAKKWGHRAIAVTDHGNVQAFPVLMEASEKLGVKVIYGMEGYLADDTARTVYGSSDDKLSGEFVVFDIETTGLSPQSCAITEIGAVLIKNYEVIEVFNTYVNPGVHIPEYITNLTGITDEMVKDAPAPDTAVKKFLDFAGDRVLIAHNASFDTSFIRRAAELYSLKFNNSYIDTLAMSRYVNPELSSHKLNDLARFYKLGDFNHHRASDDARVLVKIFFCMANRLREEGVETVSSINNTMGDKVDPQKVRTNHIVLLVKNKTGLKNLYKIVSMSYLKYFHRHPRIPRSVLSEFREGLIIGSACSEGEFYNAVLSGKSDSELVAAAKFYDYLEIHPLSNNRYLIDNNSVTSEEQLMEINRKIIKIANEANIPVVAACDAHFMNDYDEITRKILLSGMKFADADRSAGLYLRTTDEMLREFSYLGEETAYEVVIRSTNKIADMIESDIRPIPKGTFTPSLEGAEEELKNLCYNKAHSIYGDVLPDIVTARLERELESIIKNGFSVLYIIAQKLVKYSEDNGYLVGSRGSVGSSFVAALAGISEVNPLVPHYICKKCRYSEFITDDSFGSGFDLPDKLCPECGTLLYGDGHDIPFETFLGFYGDKSPDIDLNFSGDIQAKVHKYTEELFGAENVFRAGTLGSLADKTAFGFVNKYLEGHNINLNKAEKNRLIQTCVGVKRTTGQHPGGIVVIPRDKEIYDFTPVQHPADKAESNVITTHFDFNSLHDTILKLDELGHDVPTKYKMLEKYSGKSVLDVPMNDPLVYELFSSTKPLGVEPDEIGSQIGTFGLPEFGTGFVQPVIIESKAKNFADLLQVSGLTHGTDVWLGNAKELLRNGTCDISQVVGTRDGIMLSLIKYGLDNIMAFKIMEFVRKNKKGLPLSDEMIGAMKEKNVPEWYINSLCKIKYMFPKAHAAAYVMSAIRIGWYKVHLPLEFYAAFLTVASKGLDGELVMRGKAAVSKMIDQITDKNVESSQKDENMLGTLQLVNEAYARKIKFLPVDLKKSDAFAYLPEDNMIRLPFSSLNGVGETAAQRIMEVRDSGPIYSVEDLRIKSQISKTVIEVLHREGVLKGLSETNQITMF